MRLAVRLSPTSFVAGLALVHFARGELDEALGVAERALPSSRGYPFGRAMAVACAWELGDHPKAAQHLAGLQSIAPRFDASLLRRFGPNVECVDRIARAVEATAALLHRRPALLGPGTRNP